MNEFDLIARYFKPLATSAAARGLEDDAAVFAIPAEHELVVTTDTLIAGVHFFGSEAAECIAKKALRVNLSDLAAMGAAPLYYFLNLQLPRATDEAWIAAFAKGLQEDQAAYGITLAGGDTTATSGPLSLSITMMGTVPKGQALARGGAQVGDVIYVTGTIGDSALGLQLLRHSDLDGSEEHLINRYILPQPRILCGEQLRGVAHSCMDISDGLAQDMEHVCKASHVGATLYLEKIPFSEAARAMLMREPALMETVITGGDDYELLFTAPAARAREIDQCAKESNTPIAAIGEITSETEVRLLNAEGNAVMFAEKGYRHF